MKAIILLFSLFAVLLIVSQRAFVYSARMPSSALEGGHQDMILVKNRVWVVDNKRHIKVYNANGVAIKVASVQGVRAQLITNDGNDVVAQIGSQIQRWSDADSTWRKIGELPISAFALLVNSYKSVFAITEKGILDISTGEISLPAQAPNEQRSKLANFKMPSAYFIDNQDNIWIGFGYGEWGGNIFAYDTHRHKFIDLTFNDFVIELSPIKSFFQLNSSVGSSAGLQHMMSSGSIIEFEKFSARTIYDTHKVLNNKTKDKNIVAWDAMPYIGPAAYDSQSDCLYFYSNLGVFKGIYSKDLSKIDNWNKLFVPKLHWQYGQRDAVGSQMNVLKMLALGNDKLVLLTQSDGVGIWDGKAFKSLP